jgi:hypothetical protein
VAQLISKFHIETEKTSYFTFIKTLYEFVIYNQLMLASLMNTGQTLQAFSKVGRMPLVDKKHGTEMPIYDLYLPILKYYCFHSI